MDYFDYSDKVAVVTGSSSGIGAATAKAFAKHGATLTIVGRNEERLMQVAKACEEAKGKKPLCVLLDLTLKDSCEAVVRKTVETYGKIDILVNSAGKIAATSIYDDNMDNFDELVATNLRVPFKMTQLCVPHLKKSKGVVVNIFGSPMKVPPGLLVTTMIRDAMERFTRSAAVELAAEGIRMNAVRPGIVRTALLTNLNYQEETINEAYDRIAETLPSKTVIEPEEVAKMVLCAASGMCPNLNGSCINLDGASSGNS